MRIEEIKKKKNYISLNNDSNNISSKKYIVTRISIIHSQISIKHQPLIIIFPNCCFMFLQMKLYFEFIYINLYIYIPAFLKLETNNCSTSQLVDKATNRMLT